MNDPTVDLPARDVVFGACIQALEDDQEDAARKLMEETPGLAMDVAAFYRDLAQLGPVAPAVVAAPTAGGERIGDFQLIEQIGGGGQGVVYRALQLPFKRTVAVKLMRTGQVAAADEVKRFRRDSALLADLDHPNIVRVFHAGDSDQGPYYAMEFLTGTNLKKQVDAKLLPTPRHAAELIRDLALGMQHVHDRGIVHRDLKPGNVMIEDDGTPKIVDFGLGKKLDSSESITQGHIVGTASYMSPEAAAGGTTDQRSDIYGLGAILYELLTGQAPFAAGTFHETLRDVIEKDPRLVRQLNPNVPAELEIICLRCLEKDPARRFASAREFAAELQRYLNGEPILTSSPGITDRIFRNLLRQRFSNVRAWGWILIGYGTSSAVFHLLHWWFILTDQSTPMAIGLIVLNMICVVGITWLGLRGHKLRSGDWQSLSFVVSNVVLSTLLVIVYRPAGIDTMTYRYSLGPIAALLQAAVIFPQGLLFWGGFHILGLAWCVVAVVMSLVPEWSPGMFAAFSLLTLTPLGAYMVIMVPPPEFQDEPAA